MTNYNNNNNNHKLRKKGKTLSNTAQTLKIIIIKINKIKILTFQFRKFRHKNFPPQKFMKYQVSFFLI